MNEIKKAFPIPVVGENETDAALDHCSGAEPFALMVLGDSMEPEFVEGEIIVVEPEGLAKDGSFVMAWLDGEWIFRQLVGGPGGWKLRPLNPKYPTASIPDLSVIKGVIIQKSKPGRRKAAKRYVD
ncbi:S24 family peptidase [Sulfuricystis multivorans]|uniref:S24 family peptidase n=1 Tax=Sulfuricystis multivorans TaxID=2211108 RepID=UPI000F83C39E|nr:S24 family peptidase [Sulfuricystis multivorans]